MDKPKHCKSLNNIKRLLLPFAALLAVILALSSCGLYETIFKPHPKSHRLLEELEKWPHEYYWLIETGVSSRVLGIRSEGDSISDAHKRVDELLTMVKEQWEEIAPLDKPAKLIKYFQDNNLEPIAKAVKETLDANQDSEPETPGEFHQQLQARAIKQGLIAAYREVKD